MRDKAPGCRSAGPVLTDKEADMIQPSRVVPPAIGAEGERRAASVGFTMSLFISELAFKPPELVSAGRRGSPAGVRSQNRKLRLANHQTET